MTMPDWQNPDDYALPKKKVKEKEVFDCELVAWEFLRRNPEYVTDYHNVINGKFKDENGNPPQMSYHLGLGPKKAIGFPHPEMKVDESEGQWIKRCLQEQRSFPKFLSPHRYVMKKWGLHWGPDGLLPDPTKDAKALDPRPRFDIGNTPRILDNIEDWKTLKSHLPQNPHDDWSIIWDPENVVVVFSVREAPAKQWVKIRPLLSNMHKKLPKNEKIGAASKSQASGWMDALRAWDADVAEKIAVASGAKSMSHVQRGQVIWPGQQGQLGAKYKKALVRAKELVDWKYRVILHHV